MRMPVDTLISNWAYMVMASLAWNLKAWFALSLTAKGRWQEKHKRQKNKVLRMEFKTFRNYFIMVPCQIVKTGRKLLYRLLGWNKYLEILLRAGIFLTVRCDVEPPTLMSRYGCRDQSEILRRK